MSRRGEPAHASVADPSRWWDLPGVELPTWASDRADRGVCLVKVAGVWQVAAVDLPDGRPRPLTAAPAGVSVAAIDPSGRWVWWFDDGDGGEWGAWRVQAYDSEPGGHVEGSPLGPGYHTGICLGPDGLAVVGMLDTDGTSHVSRVTIDLDTGAGPHPVLLYAHAHDAAPERISPDGEAIVIRHSEDSNSEHPALRVIRTRDGAVIADADDGPHGSLRAVDWDGDRILLLRHRNRVPALAIWNLGSGELEDVAGSGIGSIRDARFLSVGSVRVVATVETTTGVQLVLMDTSACSIETVGPRTGTVDSFAVRPDGDIWYRWSSAAEPAWNISMRGTVLPNADERMRTADAIADTAPGAGGDVPYFLQLPAGNAPHPLLIDLHGGPFERNTDRFSPDSAAWIDRGYAVLKVNYRGSTGYGEQWREGILEDVGFTELADVVAVLDQLESRGVADGSRVVLSGRSWGGYLALLGAGVHPHRWAAAIAHVPVGDFTAAYEDVRGDIQAMDRYIFGGSPTDVPEVYRRASPVTYVDEVRSPVLALVSTNDPRCPYRQNRIFIDAMRSAGRDLEVYLFSGGHRSLDDAEIRRQSDICAEFATRHVPAMPVL